MRKVLPVMIAGFVLLLTCNAGAIFMNLSGVQAIKKVSPQDQKPSPLGSAPAINPPPMPSVPPSIAAAEVIDAYNPVGAKNRFELGSTLIVKVTKLDELKAAEATRKKLILYLNNIPMKGLIRENINLTSGEVRFLLNRDSASKQSWDQLICKPPMHLSCSVTVGFEDDYSITTKVTGDNALTFDIVNLWGLAGWIVFTVTLLALVIYLGCTTPLLRSAGINSSYSLAYSQMIFWTVLVCSGYVLIYLITQDMPLLNGSMLILMGLSAGTALSGKVIDLNKPVPTTTGSYLKDILQDADGYTVARMQIFIWTIITGFIFIVNVYSKMAMPEFGETLLTLMGISSGTYLGFKIPETKTPPAPPNSPQQAAVPPNPPPAPQKNQPLAMG
jgi:hypothetical protein